jgi:RNA 3'-phosphate cyclase
MPYDYFANVHLPQLQRFGKVTARLLRRGYYPKGGGQIELSVVPADQKPSLTLLEQGRLIAVKGISHCEKSLQGVADRQAMGAEKVLRGLGVPVRIDSQYADSLSVGSGVTVFSIHALRDEPDEKNPIRLGGDALGQKGRPAEIVGEEAAKKLLGQIRSGAPVDAHLGDNLVPYLGLVSGSIMVSEITPHTLTNIYVVERFLSVKFETENNVITVPRAGFLS